MPTKLKRQTARVEKPSGRILQRGLKLGQEEWDRVLLETVGNLGQASAEDIANATDLDIGRVETSLRRLAKAGKIRKTTEQKYGITAARHSKSKK
jgi:predicted transcriptional regulator